MKIKTYPAKSLRNKTVLVKSFNEDLRIFVDEMRASMQKEKGVGLAAPQVNDNRQVIMMEWDGQFLVMINPRLINHNREVVEAEEGCLSFPGLYVPLKRWTAVDMEAYDVNGNIFRMTLSGWPARIFQHELDHLRGILIIDRAGFWKKRKLLQEYYKQR